MITLPADEIESGDVIRDHGRFRHIDHVEPSMVELSLVFHFEPPDELGTLCIRSLQSVSVWRVCSEDAA